MRIMFSYDPLWLTIREKGILKKTDLVSLAGISPTTLSKLSKNEFVSMETLEKLCVALNCDISSILKHKVHSNTLTKVDNNEQITTVSLFSGIGGFEEGINNSCINANVVFSSEIDRFASTSYLANFPFSNIKGDITKIEANEVPDHNFLVAGFPCQSFSIAGKQEGFYDEMRGTLFFDIIRILEIKKPRYILLENVKNLVSHDKSRTMHIILKSLSKLGYCLDFSVVNSSETGIPQNRARTYIVGILGYERERYKDDLRNKQINSLKTNLNKKNFNSFNFFNSLVFEKKQMFLEDILEKKVERKYYFESKEIKDYLKSLKINEYVKGSKIYKHFDVPREVINDNERQRRVYSIKGLSPTLLARSDSTKILVKENEELKIRKLTPVENLRAQGFSESFITNIKTTNISDTQLYKQSGNAVSPPVITGIMNHLSAFLERKE